MDVAAGRRFRLAVRRSERKRSGCSEAQAQDAALSRTRRRPRRMERTLILLGDPADTRCFGGSASLHSFPAQHAAVPSRCAPEA
jgi:hypothetical protein